MSRPLAKRYVAIVRGWSLGSVRRRVFAGRVKREVFRDAKAHAAEWYGEGTRVTLRADSQRGSIVERVKLKRAGTRHRWRQDFET